MSTLKCTTLSKQDGSASVPVDTVVNGSAKAWISFDGTGANPINAAFNISSITDGGTGIYTFNFASAMPDTKYGIIMVPGSYGHASPDTITTTSFRVVVATASASGVAEYGYNALAIFR